MKKLILLLITLPLVSAIADTTEEYWGPKCPKAEVGQVFFVDLVNDLYHNTPEYINRDPGRHNTALVKKDKDFKCKLLDGLAVERLVAKSGRGALQIESELCNGGALKNGPILRIQNNIDILVVKQGSSCFPVVSNDHNQKCNLGSQRDLVGVKTRKLDRKFLQILNSYKKTNYVNAFSGRKNDMTRTQPRKIHHQLVSLCTPIQLNQPQNVHFHDKQVVFTSTKDKIGNSEYCTFKLEDKEYSCDSATVRLFGERQFVVCKKGRVDELVPVTEEAKVLMLAFNEKINSWGENVCPSMGQAFKGGSDQAQ